MPPPPFEVTLVGNELSASAVPPVPRYLEHSMETFAHNQDRMRQYFKDTMSGMFPFGAFNRDPNAYTTAQNNGDAKAAQTIQAQIGIKF